MSGTAPSLTPDERTQILRVLDAAANRGREGLRVLEDGTRFLRNDVLLSSQLKQLRHRLSQCVQTFGGVDLVRSRDTRGDVGTAISTPEEQTRDSLVSLLVANCKRVEESLRTLEEFSKRLQPQAAGTFEALRYEMYTLEKALMTTLAARSKLESVRTCLLIGCENPRGRSPLEIVEMALAAGCGMIQLRDKAADDRKLLALGESLRELTRNARALLIVNDRPDLAVLLDADGVHVGQDDLAPAHARRIVGTERLVGVSTHTLEQARQAVLDGADYLGVGPTFPSQTKQFDEFSGLPFCEAVANEIALPWFAISGISPENIDSAVAAGVRRVAISHAVTAADSPGDVVATLESRLRVETT